MGHGTRRDIARVRFTERLRLEPIAEKHARDLFLLHQDDDVALWHGGTYTERDAEQRAAEYANGWKMDGISKWMAYDRHTGELIGRGGLSYATVDGKRQVEIGWTVRDDKVGHGYASEIGRTGLAFHELGVHEVVAFTDVDNERSRAVMERLGMHFVRGISEHRPCAPRSTRCSPNESPSIQPWLPRGISTPTSLKGTTRDTSTRCPAPGTGSKVKARR